MNTFDSFCLWVSSSYSDLHMKTSSRHPEKNRLPDAVLPDSEFGLVLRKGSASLRALRMATPQDLATSTVFFESAQAHFPPRIRKMSAARLTQRHADLGLQVPHTLTQIGSPAADEDFPYWTDIEEQQFLEAMQSGQESQVKQSSPAPPVLHSFSFLDEEGRSQTIEVRDNNSLGRAITWFEMNHRKVSAASRRVVAEGIRDSYSKLGLDPELMVRTNKISSVVAEYCGERVRVEAPSLIEMRAAQVAKGGCLEPRQDVRDKISSAYSALAGQLRENSSYTTARVVADRVAELDQLAGTIGVTGAYEDIFLPLGAAEQLLDKSSEAEDYFVVGPTMIRERDLEGLRVVNLGQIRGYLGDEMTEKLKNNPVETFKGLTDAQRRVVARFVEEFIKFRRLHMKVPTFM